MTDDDDDNDCDKDMFLMKLTLEMYCAQLRGTVAPYIYYIYITWLESWDP